MGGGGPAPKLEPTGDGAPGFEICEGPFDATGGGGPAIDGGACIAPMGPTPARTTPPPILPPSCIPPPSAPGPVGALDPGDATVALPA